MRNLPSRAVSSSSGRMPVHEIPVYRSSVGEEGMDMPLREQRADQQEDTAASSVLSLPTVPTHQPSSKATFNLNKEAEKYTKPFLKFMTENPTVYHAVSTLCKDMKDAGFTELSERDPWKIERGGKYYFQRNGSSAIAFIVGELYEPGNGVAMVGGHVDALCLKLKPISKVPNRVGFVQLGVAPYAGALNHTWWDRDLSCGGRVLVKDRSTGRVDVKLVQLGYPIARIPTLAPHFGAPAAGPFNPETQMVPIIGLDNSDLSSTGEDGTFGHTCLGGAGSFASTQPPRLVKAICREMGLDDPADILNWDLELYDSQPAQLGGLDKEFIFAGRIDDKSCSWSAVQALINAAGSSSKSASAKSGIIQLVGLFDDEEVGSLMRQGARSNLVSLTIERILDSVTDGKSGANLQATTYANSFLVSSDVSHAVNPNFLNVYLANHTPRLNVGITIAFDSNAHMTTDAVSTALFTQCVERRGNKLQAFQIRNDSRSGGTIGPFIASAIGVRSIDAGIPQLSMHSIRATIGDKDPGLAVLCFQSFYEEFEDVDKAYRGNS